MELAKEHRSSIRNIIEEAIISSLESYPLVQCDETDIDQSAWSENLLISILGFQGKKMNGSAILGCDEEFLRRTCPGLQDDEAHPMAFIHDWIGELSNLIMGQVKNKLLPFGVVIKLNPPSISESTDQLFKSYSARMPSETLYFKNQQGDGLCFMVSCEIEQSVDLAHPNLSLHSLIPGSGIIRLKDTEDNHTPFVPQVVAMRGGKAEAKEEYSIGEFETFQGSDFDDEHLAPFVDGQETIDQDSLGELNDNLAESQVSLVGAGNTSQAGDIQPFRAVDYLADEKLRLVLSPGVEVFLDIKELCRNQLMTVSIQGVACKIYKDNEAFNVTLGGIELRVDQNK